MKNLLWRLLRRNISVGQLLGYGLANLVGLAIVLVAVQFYRDATSPGSEGDDPFVTRDYIVASRKVEGLGSIFSGAKGFTESEISDIKAQPWAESVGEFTPSRFNVAGAVSFAGQRMSTYLFFESVPDEFFDVKPRGWDFDPNDPDAEIPIILSKDYLALYNYGFAASRGMPQVSEGMIGRVPLTISLSGKGHQAYRRARIVGFSSRLNTIAVPQKFMQWANDTYGDQDPDQQVSRLIIEVNDPGNPAIAEYLEEHDIEISGEKSAAGKMAYFISIMSGIVIAIGLVISALSFFILMLSIYLLLQKNREKIRDLMLLGYTPEQTARPYYRLVIAINTAIYLLAAVAVAIASRFWAQPLDALGMTSASLLPTLLLGLALMTLVTIINLLAIHRLIRKTF